MPSSLSSTFVLLSLLSVPFLQQVSAQTSYANDFVDPDYIVAGNFPNYTQAAQQTILAWASAMDRDSPWTVTAKSATPPSGTKHDYMSWAPYWWPNCAEAGNTTVLSETEIWTTCPYERRDGQFNPDVRGVNDIGNFQTLSDAVLYATLAWSFDRTSPTFARNAVKYIQTWFLDEATRMNPNLNYAQMIRGSNGRPGSPTGVLDLKGMTKITSAILILRKANATEWTAEIDEQIITWSNEHIHWLETADLALAEGHSANNHGSFYYNQLAALKLIVNDVPGALNVTSTYFSRQYQSQIVASGEQPLEAARTRPYHYRAYNLAAMITNARIEKYANPTSDVWNRTTSEGATIKTALDYAMTHSAASSNEASYAAELYPDVAAVASVYGDANGAYLGYLKAGDSKYYADAHFLWNQGAWAASDSIPTVTAATNMVKETSKVIKSNTNNAGLGSASVSTVAAFVAVSAPLLFALL